MFIYLFLPFPFNSYEPNTKAKYSTSFTCGNFAQKKREKTNQGVYIYGSPFLAHDSFLCKPLL